MKSLIAWFTGLFAKKEPVMADPTVLPENAQPPADPLVVDTDKLKALLITLGHDVEGEWEHLVALAQKAF